MVKVKVQYVGMTEEPGLRTGEIYEGVIAVGGDSGRTPLVVLNIVDGEGIPHIQCRSAFDFAMMPDNTEVTIKPKELTQEEIKRLANRDPMVGFL